MSTEQSRISNESNQVVQLPSMGNENPEQVANKSQTHWIWTPYKDISNMGPWGIKSQLGYRDLRWTEFKRCTPYPLGNLVSYDIDRESAAATTGFNVNSEKLPKVEYVKFAQDQAAELGESYRDSGLRVLTPLLGMNDSEQVNQIIQVVQPFAYAIHEMRYEFTEGAEKRIKASNLSEGDKAKALAVAKIMLDGATNPAGSAEVRARAEYETLISSMSDKSVGQPGISNPTPFHEWICKQLNQPVPKRVDRTGGQGGNNDAINVLAQRALREESAAEEMSAKFEEERAARLELERKLDAIIAQNEAKAAQSNKQART